jgi:hypothetical protein
MKHASSRHPTRHPQAARGRRALTAALAASAMLAASALAPTTAAAIGEPLISEGAAWEVGSEVLVGAHIDPEGLETTYEIQVECPDHALCQATEGQLPAVDEARAVTLTLTDPQRGDTYLFTVTAHNTDGRASASWRFQVPRLIEQPIPPESLPTESPIPPGAAPEGVLDKEHYTPPELTWANKSGDEAAERTVREQRAKEQAEQQAKEATAQRAAALKQAEEEIQQGEVEAQRAREAIAREEAEHPACTVPALKGDTLTAARHALTHAHCRLGKVTQPHHHHSTLRVSAQAPRPGEQLAHGAPVSLTLGAKRASHRGKSHH